MDIGSVLESAKRVALAVKHVDDGVGEDESFAIVYGDGTAKFREDMRAVSQFTIQVMESLKWVELIQLREIADRVSGEAAFTGLPESLQEEIYRLRDSRCTGDPN